MTGQGGSRAKYIGRELKKWNEKHCPKSARNAAWKRISDRWAALHPRRRRTVKKRTTAPKRKTTKRKRMTYGRKGGRTKKR